MSHPRTGVARVRLETKLGELVHEGLMPLFVSPPEVILWGTRAFQYFNKTVFIRPPPVQELPLPESVEERDERVATSIELRMLGNAPFVYREVFAYALVDDPSVLES